MAGIALKSDDEEIAEQMGVDVLGASAHVILLEAANRLADGGFDLSRVLTGISPNRVRL